MSVVSSYLDTQDERHVSRLSKWHEYLIFHVEKYGRMMVQPSVMLLYY